MNPLEETLAAFIVRAQRDRAWRSPCVASDMELRLLVGADLYRKMPPDPHDGKRPRPPPRTGLLWLPYR